MEFSPSEEFREWYESKRIGVGSSKDLKKRYVFKSHRQLDDFSRYLSQMDLLGFRVDEATQPVNFLFLLYDGVFWLRHLRYPNDKLFHPSHEEMKCLCPLVGDFRKQNVSLISSQKPLADFVPVIDWKEVKDVIPFLRSDGLNLRFGKESVRNDKKVVLIAVKQNAKALKFASEELRSNKEVVMAAVCQDGLALKYSSGENVRGNRDVILASVKQNGVALQFANVELQDDHEIVIQAVRQRGSAIRYASDRLKDDEAIAKTAVMSDVEAYLQISDRLKGKKEILLEAVRRDSSYLFLYASEQHQKDKDIISVFLNETLGPASEVVFPDLKKEFGNNVIRIIFECTQRGDLVTGKPIGNDNLEYFGFVNDKGLPHGFGFELVKAKRGLLALTKTKTTIHLKSFVGRFTDGFREGEGWEFDPTTIQNNTPIMIYHGNYSKGKRHGKGREYHFFNGVIHTIYEGEYLNGRRHGRGESYEFEEAKLVDGVWENGVKVSDVFSFKFKIFPFKYIGDHLNFHKRRENVIGSGSYGTIYSIPVSSVPSLKSLVKKDEKYVAVKVFKKSYTSKYLSKRILLGDIKKFCRFVGRLEEKNQVDHILRTYALFVGVRDVAYCMELCETSIDQIISESDFSVSMKDKVRWMYETSMGIRALHGLSVMHRDLKWGNVLIDFHGHVKITDFDSLREDEHNWRWSCHYTALGGTSAFYSPERVSGNYGLPCDVYSFGVMIYSLIFELNYPYSNQICSCGVPSMHMDELSLVNHVKECNFRPELSPSKYKMVEKEYHYLFDLMQICWNFNPKKRPSFDEIVDVLRKERRKERSYTIVRLKVNYIGEEKKREEQEEEKLLRILLMIPKMGVLLSNIEKKVNDGNLVGIKISNKDGKGYTEIQTDKDVLHLIESKEHPLLLVDVERNQKKSKIEEEEECEGEGEEITVSSEEKTVRSVEPSSNQSRQKSAENGENQFMNKKKKVGVAKHLERVRDRGRLRHSVGPQGFQGLDVGVRRMKQSQNLEVQRMVKGLEDEKEKNEIFHSSFKKVKEEFERKEREYIAFLKKKDEIIQRLMRASGKEENDIISSFQGITNVNSEENISRKFSMMENEIGEKNSQIQRYKDYIKKTKFQGEGWLYKRGERVKNWKLRWVKVDLEGLIIRNYEKPTRKKPLKVIHIPSRNFQVTHLQNHKRGRFVFVINKPEEDFQYLFQACSLDDMNRWIYFFSEDDLGVDKKNGVYSVFDDF